MTRTLLVCRHNVRRLLLLCILMIPSMPHPISKRTGSCASSSLTMWDRKRLPPGTARHVVGFQDFLIPVSSRLHTPLNIAGGGGGWKICFVLFSIIKLVINDYLLLPPIAVSLRNVLLSAQVVSKIPNLFISLISLSGLCR